MATTRLRGKCRDDDQCQEDYLACWAMEYRERRNNRLLLLWAIRQSARRRFAGPGGTMNTDSFRAVLRVGCLLLGHRVSWVLTVQDETPVCARCGLVLHDGEV